MPVVGGGLDPRAPATAVDARYRAMEAHRGSGVVVSEPVKVSSRDWRGNPSADLQARQRDALASRSRERGRGVDSKSSAYESRDRGIPARESAVQRGEWGGDPMHPSGPIPTRGLIDERSRGSALPRDAAHPSWGSVGAMPVPDVRNPYGAAGGPERRHSGGADVRYDPYKAPPPRSSGMRRY